MEIIKEAREKEWNDFVSKNKNSTIFHTWKWLKVIEKTYDFVPKHQVIMENGNVTGVIPVFFVKTLFGGKRIVSLPFSYLGGPLKDSYKTDILRDFYLSEKKKTKSDYVEVRSNKLINLKDFEFSDFYSTYILSLKQGVSSVWKNLHKNSIKRAIKKSNDLGVEFEFNDTEEEIENFIRLNIRTRKGHGVPFQPRSFFYNMKKELPMGSFRLGVARKQNKTIASMIFLFFKDTVVYAYGASDPEYLKLRPNNLILWKVIEWSCKNDYSFFDFGRVSKDNNGLAMFKSRWGTEKKQVYYYYYPKIPRTFSLDRESGKSKIIKVIWSKLPLFLIRPISKYAMKEIA